MTSPDSNLDRLLDQALSPDVLSDDKLRDLESRILVRTQPLLAHPPGVIARLHAYRSQLRLAAGLVLIASLAATYLFLRQPTAMIPDNIDTTLSFAMATELGKVETAVTSHLDVVADIDSAPLATDTAAVQADLRTLENDLEEDLLTLEQADIFMQAWDL